MMNIGYHLHLIYLLVKLHRKQVANVKVAGTLSESSERSPTRLCPFSVLVQRLS